MAARSQLCLPNCQPPDTFDFKLRLRDVKTIFHKILLIKYCKITIWGSDMTMLPFMSADQFETTKFSPTGLAGC
jgi:hypothetical protein